MSMSDLPPTTAYVTRTRGQWPIRLHESINQAASAVEEGDRVNGRGSTYCWLVKISVVQQMEYVPPQGPTLRGVEDITGEHVAPWQAKMIDRMADQ